MCRAGAAGLIAGLGLVASAAGLYAQDPRPVPPPRPRPPVTDTTRVRPDTVRPRRDSLADTTRSLVPRAPTRTFPASDSIIEALLQRRGYRFTRYAADSVRLLADDKEIRLAGHGLIERDRSILEADTVRYVEESCLLIAAGTPRLFDPSGALSGRGMRYDACNHAGIVESAKTEMSYGTGKWLLQGDIAVDNAEDRIYASHATITSCELTDPHYMFASREVKWVNKRFMVSRPAVLYVADVPILWLPFIFQDTRRGRRSGMLAPEVGINDIIRFNSGYSRHISNVGYYWALSDYTDAQLSMDWYSERFTSFNGRFRYRWLDRFMAGGISYQEMHEAGGLDSRHLAWSHQQQFSLTSSLSLYLDYATSSRIISRNSVDPILATGTIDSRLNYQRRFGGGTLNLGGSRSQSLDRPEVNMTFPTLSFTPAPVALSRSITWSPSLSFTNSMLINGGSGIPLPTGPGRFDSLRTDSRNSTFNLSTPFRIRQWNVNASMTVIDQWSNGRDTTTDSTGALTTFGERFQSGIDWTAGVGLPVLFQGTWNFQPSISMVNTAPGSFYIRNTYTQGSFVGQSKRFQFAVGVAPTFFGLFPGIGPATRIRHAVSPILSWAYAPAAEIPREYALAVGNGKLPATLTQPARQSITMGLSQNFEAKLRPPAREAADTAAVAEGAEPPEGRKLKLLSIQSGGMTYDFEQAKIPGRTGWATQTWSNTISSDLVRGFSMNFSHDLWDGPVGFDGTKLDPMLSSMTFGFAVGAGTLNIVRRLLGMNPRVDDAPLDTAQTQPSATDAGRTFNAFQRGPLAAQYSTHSRLTPARGGGGFTAQFNYSLQRTRGQPLSTGQRAPDISNSMLSGALQFSPTAHWTVSWQSSYNFTQGEFADHVVRLDRDLHDWRATFTFVKSPNGNFMFNFVIHLIDEPDIKLPFDQRNVQ